MSAKKGKGLALQLIDDLLGGEPKKQNDPKEEETQVPIGAGDDTALDKNEVKENRDLSLINDLLSLSEQEVQKPKIENKEQVVDSSEVLTDIFNFEKPEVKNRGLSSTREVLASSMDPGMNSSPTEAILSRSEGMRMAQQRILDLENEVERLRLENEQLAAAGETVRLKAEESIARAESFEAKMLEIKEQVDDERDLHSQALSSKERSVRSLKMKIDEMEMRLSTNIQKIRVRERELENRLELTKLEGTAVVRNKDELILSLKRQLDQSKLELDNYRSKGQELSKHIVDKNELLKRTVKALRLALSMLEGEEEINE